MVAGTSDTYTVVVSNTGPSDASNLSVVDTLPDPGPHQHLEPEPAVRGHLQLRPPTPGPWPRWPSGQSVTLELAGTVPSGATGSTYANTATASASDASTVTATDTDTLSAQATLAITKTDNDGGSSVTAAVGTAVPGHVDHLHHRGLELRALDAPPGRRSPTRWRSTRPSPPTPGRPPDRGGHRLQRLGIGQHRRLGHHPCRGLGHLHGDGHHPAVGHRHPVQHGHRPATDASTVSATDTDTLSAQATLAITKTDGVSSVVAGTSDTYTIVVSNTGPSDASNLSVVDTLPDPGPHQHLEPEPAVGGHLQLRPPTPGAWPRWPSGQSVTLRAGRHRPVGGHRIDLRRTRPRPAPPTPPRSRPPTPTPSAPRPPWPSPRPTASARSWPAPPTPTPSWSPTPGRPTPPT